MSTFGDGGTRLGFEGDLIGVFSSPRTTVTMEGRRGLRFLCVSVLESDLRARLYSPMSSSSAISYAGGVGAASWTSAREADGGWRVGVVAMVEAERCGVRLVDTPRRLRVVDLRSWKRDRRLHVNLDLDRDHRDGRRPRAPSYSSSGLLDGRRVAQNQKVCQMDQ